MVLWSSTRTWWTRGTRKRSRRSTRHFPKRSFRNSSTLTACRKSTTTTRSKRGSKCRWTWSRDRRSTLGCRGLSYWRLFWTGLIRSIRVLRRWTTTMRLKSRRERRRKNNKRPCGSPRSMSLKKLKTSSNKSSRSGNSSIQMPSATLGAISKPLPILKTPIKINTTNDIAFITLHLHPSVNISLFMRFSLNFIHQ